MERVTALVHPLTEPREPSGLARAAGLALPALLAVLVFANTLPNELVYDDPSVVATARELGEAGPGRFLVHGRGLTLFSVYLDSLVWGSWTPGFHLTNLLLHAAVSSLAALAAYRLLGSFALAVLAGCLFAVHPVHVEAVASIENRKELLAMLVVLAALLCHQSVRRPRLGYVASLILYVVGIVLVKDVAVAGLALMLPLTDLLLGDRRGLRERPWRTVLRPLPFVAGALAALLWFSGPIARQLEPEVIERTSEGACGSYAEVVASVGRAVPEGLRLLFLPLELSVDYPAAVNPRPSDTRAILGFSAVLLWLLLAASQFRTRPRLCWCLAWPVVMFAPSSNLYPLGRFFVAERYHYVPSLGVCLLLAGGILALASLAPRRPARLAALLALPLIGAGALRSLARNHEWRDEITLLESAFRAVGPTFRLHCELGEARFDARDHEQAIEEWGRALELRPSSPRVRAHLAEALRQRGRFPEACATLEEGLRDDPPDPLLSAELGICLETMGRHREAIGALERALATARDPRALTVLSLIRSDSRDPEVHDYDAARRLAEEAVRASGARDALALLALALALERSGDPEKALESAAQADQVASRTALSEEVRGRVRMLLTRLTRNASEG